MGLLCVVKSLPRSEKAGHRLPFVAFAGTEQSSRVRDECVRRVLTIRALRLELADFIDGFTRRVIFGLHHFLIGFVGPHDRDHRDHFFDDIDI